MSDGLPHLLISSSSSWLKEKEKEKLMNMKSSIFFHIEFGINKIFIPLIVPVCVCVYFLLDFFPIPMSN